MRRVAGPHSIENLDYEDGKNYAVVKFINTSREYLYFNKIFKFLFEFIEVLVVGPLEGAAGG